jgi:hypothetical protein
VTPELYDAVREAVGWERGVPDGGISHLAWATSDGMRIVDAWESPEHFQRFVAERLTPGVQAVGITTEPEVEVHPAHAVFLPGAG